MMTNFIDKCKGPLITALLAVGYDEVSFDEWVEFCESSPRFVTERSLPAQVVVRVGRSLRSSKEKYFIYPVNKTN